MNAEYRAGYRDGLFGHDMALAGGDYTDGFQDGAADRLRLQTESCLAQRASRALEARHA